MKFMDDSIVKGNIVNDRLVAEGEKVLYKTYNRFPVAFDHAKGVELYDAGGHAYLDFGAGIAVAGLGYGNTLVDQAMKEQIDRGLLHTSNLFYNEPSIEAAEKLLAASGMDRVFFTNSGTEAIEGALKIARRYHYNKGRAGCEIIAMQGSFHGRSMGALSVTGKDHYRAPFEPLIGGVRFATFNDLDSVKAQINENTGAIIMETIQGEGGIYPATEDFLRGVRQLCDEHDLLLILDEIQCGMGRSGAMFAWQAYGVKPDVLTVAKALGNGVPIGAFLACGEAAHAMQPGDHGSTYGGNPFVCAAACLQGSRYPGAREGTGCVPLDGPRRAEGSVPGDGKGSSRYGPDSGPRVRPIRTGWRDRPEDAARAAGHPNRGGAQHDSFRAATRHRA